MKQRLKLTQEGVEKLKGELEDKRKELRDLRQYKAAAAENEGDAWHDNFAFEQTEIQERAFQHEISRLQNQLDTAEIIEVTNFENQVNIGSKVTINMIFSDDDDEEYTFTLGSVQNMKEDVISVNSPLGECVLGKSVGFEGKYKVKESEIKIQIKSITN